MPGLGSTVAALKTLHQKRREAVANLAEPLRLTLVAPGGGNPGHLRMLTYVPPGLPAGAPLVVALHGCTQNAAAYDHGAGWSTLAERHGFAVLYPEQQRQNNPNLCFNWFEPDDIVSGGGEADSIRQMVEQMVSTHHLDARRVFITGLSAGGAMTAVLLATAPGTFAGGAIIAGLPYGAARGVQEALAAMNQVTRHDARGWGERVRAASPGSVTRPAVQIWQGLNDSTVRPGNSDELVLQWTNVLGLTARPTMTETVDGARHEVWRASDGRAVLERWMVPGLGHGTPITPDDADLDRSVGIAAPYMLASSVSSTWHLARGWGLLTQAARPRPSGATSDRAGSDVQSVIHRALRAGPGWSSNGR